MERVEDAVIDGFYFADRDMREEARKEAEGVRYMRARVDLQQPERVLQIYRKVVNQGMFRTQAGYAYLRELQEYLKASPGISEEDVPPVPVRPALPREAARPAEEPREAPRPDDVRTRRALRVSLLANFVAVAAIIVMFAIAMSSSNPTVLNYEKALVDRYSTWQQELEEREAAVREKERALSVYGEED